MTKSQAETMIANKVNAAWADKAVELFRELTFSMSVYTTVSGLRICGDWPHRGSITFTRDVDGKKCRLYMTTKQWVAVAK